MSDFKIDKNTEIFLDMPNETYHSANGISKSNLDKMHISPLHYKTYKDTPQEDTEALLFGRAYHTMIGQPELFDGEFAIAPKCDRRTKQGKADYESFLLEAGNKTILSEKDFDKLCKMKEAFYQHPIAPKLIDGGIFETSIFWDNKDLDIRCKCRPDCINNDYIIDFKTTESSNPDEFMKSAYKYRYYAQSDWYQEGYKAAYGKRPKGFIFIAQEKTAPFAVTVFEADWYFTKLGEIENLEDARKFSNCVHSNKFYGYGYNENSDEYEIQKLNLPIYALKNNFADKMGG